MEKKSLLEFIAEAHKNTYAAPTAIKKIHKMETPFLPGHKCYYFKDGDWEYYDGYAGSLWAPGREIILLKGKPIWSMSYQGQAEEDYSEEFFNKTLDFLKSALRNCYESMPFRGPKTFSDGDYEYEFEISGNYEYFTGKEIITYNGMPVFFQDVMGGLIK